MKPTAVMNFCPFCAHDLRSLDGEWPKTCPGCTKQHYHPVMTVVVCIVITNTGPLIIQRGIPPQQGGWAFPGGYQNFGETAQEAAARELKEEVGLDIHPKAFRFASSTLSDSGMSLLFFRTQVSGFLPETVKLCPTEVRDWKIAKTSDTLCFPSHDKELKRYYIDEEGAHWSDWST